MSFLHIHTKQPVMKANEATRNRPEGDRVLDASYVIANIEERIDQLKDEEAWDKNDRNGITLVKNDRLTIVLTCLQKGAAIERNSIDGMITIQVIDGRLEITTDADNFELKEKEIITLQPNITHSLKAVKETAFLLTNYI
jgi:quercetin dioxygenase-like cupin family protein